jgi:hypothetical protein
LLVLVYRKQDTDDDKESDPWNVGLPFNLFHEKPPPERMPCASTLQRSNVRKTMPTFSYRVEVGGGVSPLFGQIDVFARQG